MRPERGWEITDLLWPTTVDGARSPVVQAHVAHQLRDRRQWRAARIVARMPAVDGVISADYIDSLGIRVHCELQRLSEELQFHRRVAARLAPLVQSLRASGAACVRIVDVGCGLGFVLRSISVSGLLGPGVELVGVDQNAALVAEADRLARIEQCDCRFVVGDAFEPGLAIEVGRPTIVISSGLLHHLPEVELPAFFAAQADLGVAAFVHWDIAPCLWSTVGAWVFHRARMREPVSRHDGVLSARRSHPSSVLIEAAAGGAESYRCTVDDGPRWRPRALDVLRPVVGVASTLRASGA